MPYVPQKYRDCFASVTKLPPPGNGYTLAQAVTIMANTRQSELKKAACGKDLIAWAEGVTAVARGAK